MSYLLDALRKAERERQRDRMPDLAQLHESRADDRSRRSPSWVAPVVAALVLLNLGALSAFWLWRGSDTVEPSAPVPPEPPELVPEPRRPDTAPVDDAVRFEPAAPGAALSTDTPEPLPPIELSGHLYSSIPGRSFVLVDGRRYREGERLREGPAVVSIDEEGALLDYRGERFRVAAPR